MSDNLHSNFDHDKAYCMYCGEGPSPEADPTGPMRGCKRLGTDFDCDPGCISSCVASPADAPSDLRAWWDGLTDDERWDAFVIEKSNADALSRGGADPATAEVFNLSSSSQPDAEGLDVAIRDARAAFPEQRLCQIIVNATSSDPFYVTDAALTKALREYARLAPDSAQEAE